LWYIIIREKKLGGGKMREKRAEKTLKKILQEFNIKKLNIQKVNNEILNCIPQIVKEIGHELSRGMEDTVIFITDDGKVYYHEKPYIYVKLSPGMGGDTEEFFGEPIKSQLPPNCKYIILISHHFFDNIYLSEEENYDFSIIHIYEI
jgi:hypothetical protein